MESLKLFIRKPLVAFLSGVVVGVGGTYGAKWVAGKVVERRERKAIAAANAALRPTGT